MKYEIGDRIKIDYESCHTSIRQYIKEKLPNFEGIITNVIENKLIDRDLTMYVVDDFEFYFLESQIEFLGRSFEGLNRFEILDL